MLEPFPSQNAKKLRVFLDEQAIDHFDELHVEEETPTKTPVKGFYTTSARVQAAKEWFLFWVINTDILYSRMKGGLARKVMNRPEFLSPLPRLEPLPF